MKAQNVTGFSRRNFGKVVVVGSVDGMDVDMDSKEVPALNESIYSGINIFSSKEKE